MHTISLTLLGNGIYCDLTSLNILGPGKTDAKGQRLALSRVN